MAATTAEATAEIPSEQQEEERHEDQEDTDDDDVDDGEPRDRAKPGKKPNKKPAKKPSPQELKLKKEFMLIDVNNSGFIDKADLVKATGGYLPESFFTNAIKLMDTNRDGKISFEEYKIVRGLASSLKEAAFGKKTGDGKK
ncbi:expressed unknown protein [Seminavis robusta]|uniref:EF-hand domain-containing protein n=1 Tax=Seminavis robusta TaxID=568900 RepID=A0A9N8DXE4_9STRA|nr:expressed unknown protein [Seminavis robusta]|eukprot:Sro366_g127510.1 n/a (141) ;mRNA; r:2852-3274